MTSVCPDLPACYKSENLRLWFWLEPKHFGFWRTEDSGQPECPLTELTVLVPATYQKALFTTSLWNTLFQTLNEKGYFNSMSWQAFQEHTEIIINFLIREEGLWDGKSSSTTCQEWDNSIVLQARFPLTQSLAYKPYQSRVLQEVWFLKLLTYVPNQFSKYKSILHP